MKILNTHQIRALDEYTIEHEPIASIDLMERASLAFVKWFKYNFPDRNKRICIFCGPGNNGGDGLAIGRLLSQDHYEVVIHILEIGSTKSPDFQVNIERVKQARCCPIEYIKEDQLLPKFGENDLLVDAIFGSGLSRPIEGYWADFINYLNAQASTKVAVDIPSGMFADQPTTGISMQADFTFSFEMPKLGFLFPENADRVGEWSCGSIGLHPDFIEKENTPFYFTDIDSVKPLLQKRKKYSHKGSYGHALLVAGSLGKVGAACLAAKAILRSGAGLLTIHAPKCAYQILQTVVPEAMVVLDEEEEVITNVTSDLAKFNSFGIGPGIGTNNLTANALEDLLDRIDTPIVLDADALNLIASNPSLFNKIPKQSILTPHPKEFERLFGTSKNNFERNDLQREKAKELGIYIILKGAHTAIACPDGSCHFNSSGNPGMATGGSGDVLTGIITGLLASGYQPFEAAIFGVYLHGLAGDLAVKSIGQEALLANDLIEYLGKAFLSLKQPFS
ncbi:MAG: NAD(P)H-hydrate dehydratase [Saprospiraceae bacterium]